MRNTRSPRQAFKDMEQAVSEALAAGGIADMTTIGRRSGLPRRIEIYFHHFDGDLYIGGRPGFKRDWLANLIARPEFTLHLKRGVQADVAVVATEVTDPETRRRVFFRMLTESWRSDPDRARGVIDRYVADSPLVKVEVVNQAAAP
ncbi:MAG TPA: nitroreductase/quinone reductase family protein [Acidimicrobiia bacterium]|nr:nitroreductase/quinone reductase family protein [Acidimicrobiia bacterium]